MLELSCFKRADSIVTGQILLSRKEGRLDRRERPDIKDYVVERKRKVLSLKNKSAPG